MTSARMLQLAGWLYVLAAVLLVYALLVTAMRLPQFALKEVIVLGNLNHVTRDQVQLLATSALRGTFFTLDLEKTRRTFEKLPWVRTVVVSRHWPNQLKVTLDEHEVLARWNDSALVSTQGVLFQAASDQLLPVLTGPTDKVREIAAEYVSFKQTLVQIKRQLATVEVTTRGAWTLTLDDGMTLALGRNAVDDRLARFVQDYPRTLGLLNRGVTHVDLRYPTGFAVTLAPAPARRKTPNTSNTHRVPA